jgi:hypothetical protein
MTGLDATLGLFFIIMFAGLIMIFSLPRWNKKARPLRKMEAVEKLKLAIGLTVEAGTRIHISLGNADLLSPSNSSALAGLSVLEQVALISQLADRKPISTSGNGAMAVLSNSVFKNSLEGKNTSDQISSYQGQLSGTTPLSYAVGTINVIRNDQVSANVFLGNYGSEVILLSQNSSQMKAITLGASDSLTAQSVLFASSDEPLIGEELYALPAYLGSRSVHNASVKVQDFFRWVLIFTMLAGAVMKYLGYL